MSSSSSLDTAEMQFEAYLFDPRPKYPLLIPAKRYWHPSLCSNDPEALTLICIHPAGQYKELWEPTLRHMFSLMSSGLTTDIKVREAWAIDAPNHGDSAIANEYLFTGYPSSCYWEDYTRSLHVFLAGLGTGVDIDFRKRNLVGIGVSAGCVPLVLIDTYIPTVEFSSLILAEPMILSPLQAGNLAFDMSSGAARRQYKWKSRVEALRHMRANRRLRTWAPEVQVSYVENALRDLPTALYPEEREGVTLKCPREYEAAGYREFQGIVRAYDYLRFVCLLLPVHFIFGAQPDLIPESFHADMLRVAAEGRYASMYRVQGSGHMIIQQQPAGLAAAVLRCLQNNISRSLIIPRDESRL
ncbi:uncharacterized protein PHACADRAFT_126011 [Phanerochaete carnosa HHB-10118-sp]|uniref:AB hydrolase-1 domain-containing protein n=1 Tax=Phanerochaete carnosa (strain HHB-10118-sp) TaxID=650164 RepID=K5WPQ7_PHACS|nr:uncharacterized protein PHACADRAFT_126011 [Phanerochaete carnosa HHB-10118-sp]EKM52297.1 hypothetical protein PHACADRAFT_126011 [Phanerochaete carnosa HHB-10118-sp]